MKEGLTLRTARQEWPCRTHDDRRYYDHGTLPAEHTVVITKGAQYVEDCTDTPPFQSGKRYCLACARAAGIVEGPNTPTLPLETEEERQRNAMQAELLERARELVPQMRRKNES